MNYIDFRLEYIEESKDEVLDLMKDLINLGFNCKHYEEGGLIFCRYSGNEYNAILTRGFGEYMYLNIFEDSGALETIMRIDIEHIACITHI